MDKLIDLNQTMYELTKEYPELIDIMKSLGFAAIGNPIARNTVGRTMTIPAGCAKQGIPLEKVINNLEKNGYRVTKYKMED